MNRFFGMVGFSITTETSPGVLTEQIVKRSYYGEFLSEGFNRDNNQVINSNINLSNRVSLLADNYAFTHAAYIAYVEIAGTKWAVNTVSFEGKRMICTFKGIYEGGDENDG